MQQFILNQDESKNGNSHRGGNVTDFLEKNLRKIFDSDRPRQVFKYWIFFRFFTSPAIQLTGCINAWNPLEALFVHRDCHKFD